MGKVIKKSDNPGFFAQGGKTKMFGERHAGPQTPGQSATMTTGDGGKFAVGGKTKMFGKGHANQAPSGVSIKSSQ